MQLATRGGGRRAARRVLVTVGLVWMLVALSAGPGTAQSGTPASTDFTPGTASAQATLVSPTIAAGNLHVEVLLGAASASYRDRSALGDSTLADIPILRVASSSHVCGRSATDVGAFLPADVVADTSVNGNTRAVELAPSNGGQGASQSAQAAPGAKASATTTLASALLPPLVELTGATTTVGAATKADTQTRTATAQVRVGDVKVLGGLLTLHGLRWDLSQTRVGPDHRADTESSSAGFHLDGISVALPGAPAVSIPVPGLAQLPAAIDRVNALLAPLGLQIRLPAVSTNPAAGSHTVSPLTIAMGGKSWLLAPVFATLLNNPQVRSIIQTVLHNFFDAQHCKELGGALDAISPDVNTTWNTFGSSAPLLIAVATAALGGTGEVQLNVGGVTTTIDDTYYPPPGFAPAALGEPSPGATGTAATPGTPGATTGAAPGATPVGPPAAAPTASADQAPAMQRTAVHCQSTSPAGRPGCWLGRGFTGALAAGVFTLGVLVVDEAFRRRKTAAGRRREPTT